MFKFLKQHKLFTLLGSLITLSLTSAIVATVAWFQVTGKDTINGPIIPSGVRVSYFDPDDSGTGLTANSPFVISKPEHLYNLMELMKSDTAKMTSESSVFYTNEYYFSFGKNTLEGPKFYNYSDDGVLLDAEGSPTSKYLNMKYYSEHDMLTPIGSPSHPFIGHLDGHNLTVDNISIDGTDCSDVGIFGYIASPANTLVPSVKNAYFDHLEINVGISNLSNQSNSDLEHPWAHNEHSHEGYAAVGYIVGHVYDANAALKNVYVNNCSVVNQSAGNKAVHNNFGYIGCSDTNEVIDDDDASQTEVELNASSLNNYLTNNIDNNIGTYSFSASNGSSAKSPTRDAGYLGSSKTVNQMISGSSGTYNFTPQTTAGGITGNGVGNTSLATAGYTSNNTIVRDVNYEIEGASGSSFEMLKPSTQILSSVPDPSTLNDGWYLYYDSSLEEDDDKSNWQYLEVQSGSGVVTTVQLNCFYMTFKISTTTYYAVHNAGNLTVTDVRPEQAAASQLENYYFCLRESAGSYGISSYSTANAQTDFHIFSVGAKKYLHASTSGVSSQFSFIENFSSALEFTQETGNNSPVVVKGNTQYKFLCSSSSISLKRFVGTDVGSEVNILFKGVSDDGEPQASYSPNYELVTSSSSALTANDILTFVYKDTDDKYYAIAGQAKNNRLTTDITDAMANSNTRIDGSVDSAKSLSSFLLEGNSSAWEFKDTLSNQYLYAAGNKSSGQNYLRSQDTNNSRGKWTISTNSTGQSIIQCIDNNCPVPYIDYISGSNNEGPYRIFRAYRNASCQPMIFRRSQLSGQTTYIHSSFQHPVETTSTSNPKYYYYNLRYNWVSGAAITTADLFLDDASAVFILTNSTVRFKPTGVTGTLQLVTSADQLTAGAKYAFATDYIVTKGNTSYLHYTFASTTFNQGHYIQSTIYTNPTAGIDNSNNYSYIEDGIAFCYEDILLMDLGGDSTNGWTFLTNNSEDRAYSSGQNTYTDSDGYLTTDDSHPNYILKDNSIQTLSRFTISIADSTSEATIMSKNSGIESKYVRYVNNYQSFEMQTTGQEGSQDIYLYKFIPLGETSYIGDQIGDNYNPDYIDVVGGFTSTSSAMTFQSSSAYSSTPSNKFHAPALGSSAVVFAQYSGSMDLGRIDITYTQTNDNSLKVNKCGSSNQLKSVESDLDIDNEGEDDVHINTLYITKNNIKNYALCALDDSGNVVATYDSSGNVTGDDENAKYFVIVFKANGGSVSISRIAYSFMELPGNSGNFGLVGYRSADYTGIAYDSDNKVWTQTTPNHATSSTILNYYFKTDAGVYSYINVKYSFTDDSPSKKIYYITAYCTKASKLYLFNYDPTEYEVYVNGVKVVAGSNVVTINATQYDFETGWAT